MLKLLWLDDEPLTVSYEKNTLVPEHFDSCDFEILYFEKIAELMEYLYHHKVHTEDLFVIDIMLLFEKEMLLPDSTQVTIPDELMAGVTLYTEFLRHKYPQNPVILYTSREHDQRVFANIISDPRYGETLFLIDKWQKDTKFLETLAHFIKDKKCTH
jgi:hypothetical protein